ncbi:uncharacterized protein F5Z01DRAFT_672276 [Emericellopsis atlantica]|uniref:Heterokaryon incompatibility domain-containing protein n=1 Tax=Emericellopsis atlantica TaxID=2614577 RepID=A0A9P7ZR29_9HYPO|nr:uncharacterized protein F5Z01DRAFT_672276 [Emericellopsis atlantica]KAG9256281.1 hypothetical protein F5Z01DRAFT_672276 [Emericellopsis atlantica]
MSEPRHPFVEGYEANQQCQMEQARALETASDGDDNRLIDHDDNWRELEDEKDQVFVGGVRNYYYKSKGRWIPQRGLFNFAKLDQEQLGSFDFRSMHHPLTPPQVPLLPSVIGDPTAGKEGAYPFAPLPSEKYARFLEILPADSGELRCRLHTAKISDCRLGYEYLSYSTDKSIHAPAEPNQGRMVINGSSGQSREVLIRLLETLRLPERSRLIWAPHLCIDVADVNDRNRHTKLAATIIQNASRTIVWLGSAGLGNYNTGFASICAVVNSWRARTGLEEHLAEASYSTKPDPGFQSPKQRCVGSLSEAWLPAIEVFRSSWFTSTWSLQEVSVARSVTVMQSDKEISWDWIGLSSSILRENLGRLYGVWHRDWPEGKRPIVEEGVLSAYFMYRLSQSQSCFEPVELLFHQLLSLTRQFKCRIGHDRIYALLGVPTADADGVANRLKVDYGVKEPQLNHSVACHLAEMDGPASFLGQVHHDHDGRHKMRVSNNSLSLVVDGSSWVPWWQTALSDPIEPLVPHADFSAGTALRPRILKQPDPTKLVVRGVWVDEVESARSLDRYNTFWRGRDTSTYSKHVNFDLSSGPGSPTLKAPPRLERAMLGDELRACGLTTIDLSQLAVTLSCGKVWEGTPVSDIEGHVADYARCILRNGLWWSLDWLRKIKRQQGADPGQEQAMSVSDLEALSTGGSSDRFLDCAATAGRNRATFVSKHGIWGLGPDAMKQGDKFCVVSGLAAPLVLRSNNHKDNSFQVVGSAYAFDVMHGEVAEVAQSKDGWLTESWIQLI